MRPAALLALAVAMLGCHDFDAAPQLCLANGVCRSNIDQDAGQFTLRVDPSAPSLGPGGTALLTLTLTRPKGTLADPVTFGLSGGAVDAGLTLQLSVAETRGIDEALLVRVPLPFPAGVYPLTVTATRQATSDVVAATVDVTVRAPAQVLLVDDDASANNGNNPFGAVPSADDRFYRERLSAADDFTVRTATGAPTLAQLTGYASVVWFTGAAEDALTAADRTALLRWLDLGGRRLLLVAQGFPSDVGGGWRNATDPLLRDAIGAAGAAFFTGGTPSVRSGSGLVLDLRNGDPIETRLAVLNLSPGTATAVMTTRAIEPFDGGLNDLPVATVRPNAGDAGTSTVGFIGFPLVNATDAGAAATAFDAIRAAAGIP